MHFSTFAVGAFSGAVAGMALFDWMPILQQPDNLVLLCFAGLGLGIPLLARCMR